MISYHSEKDGNEVVFHHTFEARTDIVGPAALKLWVTAEDAEDADIFVGLRKLDAKGSPVTFPFSNNLEKGPVALGWLRASHSETDPAKSTPDRPWHLHKAEKPLIPGERKAVEIEIWPSATRFEKGERLQLVVRGSDLYTVGTFSRHLQTNNNGAYTITTGKNFESHLVINVIENIQKA